MSERRFYWRYQLPTGLQMATVRIGKREYHGRLTNASAGGCMVQLPGRLEASSNMEIEVLTHLGWQNAKVVHTDHEDGTAIFGLEWERGEPIIHSQGLAKPILIAAACVLIPILAGLAWHHSSSATPAGVPTNNASLESTDPITVPAPTSAADDGQVSRVGPKTPWRQVVLRGTLTKTTDGLTQTSTLSTRQ